MQTSDSNPIVVGSTTRIDPKQHSSFGQRLHARVGACRNRRKPFTLDFFRIKSVAILERNGLCSTCCRNLVPNESTSLSSSSENGITPESTQQQPIPRHLSRIYEEQLEFRGYARVILKFYNR